VAARLGITPQFQPQGEKRYVREKGAGNLRDRWPTVAPPMRDSFGEAACLDSQPPRPPCDFRYMHFDPYNSISVII
jgi:hypothetical protein